MGLGYRKRVLITFMPVHFINDLYSNLIPPLLPLLIISLSLSHLEAGFLSSATMITSAILHPLISYLAEYKSNRKLIIIVGFLTLGFSVSLFSLFKEFWQLVITALLISLGLSTYHPQAMASLSEAYKESKGKIFGIHGVSGALGFALSPLIVAFSNELFGWREVFKFAFLPTLIIALLLWKLISLNQEQLPKSLKVTSIDKSFLLLLISAFLISFSFRGLIVFVPTYYVHLGEEFLLANLLLFITLLPQIIGSPIGGYLSDRIGRKRIILISIFLQATFISIFSLIRYLSIPSLFIIGLSNALGFPVFMAYSTELGRLRGASIGYMFGMIMGSSAISPTFTGFIIDLFGFEWAFLTLAMISLLSIIPIFGIKDMIRNRE
ncbi:MAG: MFS transporter [Nitrososphaerales archaeon]